MAIAPERIGQIIQQQDLNSLTPKNPTKCPTVSYKKKLEGQTDEQMIEEHTKRIAVSKFSNIRSLVEFWNLHRYNIPTTVELQKWRKVGTELRLIDVVMTVGLEEAFVDFSKRLSYAEKRRRPFGNNSLPALAEEGRKRFFAEIKSKHDPEYAAAKREIDAKWFICQENWD